MKALMLKCCRICIKEVLVQLYYNPIRGTSVGNIPFCIPGLCEILRLMCWKFKFLYFLCFCANILVRALHQNYLARVRERNVLACLVLSPQTQLGNFVVSNVEKLSVSLAWWPLPSLPLRTYTCNLNMIGHIVEMSIEYIGNLNM